MTPTISYDRAAEIIAAYGGDTARWPEAERAGVLQAIAAHPGLAASLAAAAAVDRDLVHWARRPVAGADAARAAAVAMATARQPRTIMRWAAGGSIAASLAAAIVLLAPAPLMRSTAVSGGVRAVSISDEAAFAQVFTPTPDEENIL